MERILCAGSGKLLGATLLSWIKEWGFGGIRQDIPLGAPQMYISNLVSEVYSAGMTGVFIVGGWLRWNGGDIVEDRDKPRLADVVNSAVEVSSAIARAQARAGVAAINLNLPRSLIECGNEPNITKGLSPGEFATMCRDTLDTIRGMGHAIELITGGVSNLRKDEGLKYLSKAIQLGLPLGSAADRTFVGVHPYRSDYPAWKDFEGNAIADLYAEVKRVCGRIAVTEIGWHTAPQGEETYDDIDVARFAQWELDEWASVGAELLAWYQINDGPTDAMVDNWGIRFFGEGRDRDTKTVVNVFQKWEQLKEEGGNE